MQQTTNYNLKKIELTDSPPDITVINPNWDAIDTELKAIRDADVAHKAESTAHGINLKANKIQENWISPTLLNGWAIAYAPGYRKNEFGVLEFKGIIANGATTAGTTLFTLPVEYRPLALTQITCSSYTGSANKVVILRIETTGVVTIYGDTSLTYINLNSIVF